MYYDDYFNEPSEFQAIVETLKQSLVDSVKEEYKEEIERLRKENEELQDIKKRMDEIELEHKNAIRQLKVKEEEVGRTALNKLLDNTRLIMFAPDEIRKRKPKCNRCDNDRRIKYKTPLGKDAYEYCECNNSIKSFKPAEIMRYEFCQSSWGRQ